MSFSAKHLKRYKEIGWLLWKHGRFDLAHRMGLGEPLEKAVETAQAEGEEKPLPEQLADDLEAMGPTYVKLGQVLSSRADLLPEVYLKSLARLQNNVKPFPFEEVQKIVEGELGVRISKAFSRFDVSPIAAASLGQVHSAALRDGRPVAVKVQRPDIQKQVAEDFEVLSQIAEFLDAHTEWGRKYRSERILEEFRITVQQELNYEREAQNLIVLGNNLREFPLIHVPQPILDYSSRSVLTMEYIDGRKITALGPLDRLDMQGAALAEELFQAYLKQVLVDGLFHADPHPGNVFLTRDGQIALLDLGMVGHTSPRMQENLLKLLLAISEGSSEQAANILIRLSQTRDDFNPTEFLRCIRQLMAARQDQDLQKINVGKSLLELSSHAVENGLFVPSELTMLGKTLLQLDEIGQILDPTFDPNASIRSNVSDLMAKRVRKNVTQANIYATVMELKNFFGGLPQRLNRIMDAVNNRELEVKVKAVDTELMMEGFQKIANRITTGIVLAALIMGAALLMQVQTSFRIFDYPGLAILCFMGAASGGFWLVFSIFIQDRKRRKK